MALIEEIVKKLEYGEETSDVGFKAAILKEVLYKAADSMLVGKELVAMKDLDDLVIQFSFPSTGSFTYPVPEGATARSAQLTWTTFNLELQKGMGEIVIPHEAVIRGSDRIQTQVALRRQAEQMAIEIDHEIFDTLLAGAGQSQAASATWDGATATQISGDVAGAISKVLQNTTISESELRSAVLAVPAKVAMYLYKVQEINNMRMNMMDYFKDSWGFKIRASRYLTTDALFVVPGTNTAIHGTLKTGKVPLAEATKIPGVGTKYTILRFFKTAVVPESDSVSTSYRICKITGVAS